MPLIYFFPLLIPLKHKIIIEETLLLYVFEHLNKLNLFLNIQSNYLFIAHLMSPISAHDLRSSSK